VSCSCNLPVILTRQKEQPSYRKSWEAFWRQGGALRRFCRDRGIDLYGLEANDVLDIPEASARHLQDVGSLKSAVLISQYLYYFESNTRSATIIGIVGAG